MKEKDIDFIARHYSDDAFSPEAGWRRLKFMLGLRRRRFGAAVAVAVVIALSSSAAIIGYWQFRDTSKGKESVEITIPVEISESPNAVEFRNESLSEVVKVIESEFGVVIGNIPPDADDYRLTLRFEGTPQELIEAINETLGTHLIIMEI